MAYSAPGHKMSRVKAKKTKHGPMHLGGPSAAVPSRSLISKVKTGSGASAAAPTKTTGTAHALTSGQGRKVGLIGRATGGAKFQPASGGKPSFGSGGPGGIKSGPGGRVGPRPPSPRQGPSSGAGSGGLVGSGGPRGIKSGFSAPRQATTPSPSGFAARVGAGGYKPGQKIKPRR